MSVSALRVGDADVETDGGIEGGGDDDSRGVRTAVAKSHVADYQADEAVHGDDDEDELESAPPVTHVAETAFVDQALQQM